MVNEKMEDSNAKQMPNKISIASKLRTGLNTALTMSEDQMKELLVMVPTAPVSLGIPWHQRR
jgi:hypothetical protein